MRGPRKTTTTTVKGLMVLSHCPHGTGMVTLASTLGSEPIYSSSQAQAHSFISFVVVVVIRRA